MNGLTPKELKNLARQRLSQAAYAPQKLTLIYSGIVLGLNLLAVILNWVTGRMMDSTGGLSGMDTRAVLDTVSTVFSLAVHIATPLLTMGFLYCAIRFARQKELTPKSLTMGLRRWAVILRHGLLVGGIFLAIAYAALQIGSIIFMFLPGADQTTEMMYALMEDPAVLEGNIPTEQLGELVNAFMPVYLIAGVLFVAAMLPVGYRLRLSSYRIMEDTPVGAVKAVFSSNKLMKGNCVTLFKLDLSFWWFYTLQLVLSTAMTAISLLSGISDGWYVIVSAVYSLAMLTFEYFTLAYVQTTYAVFYDTLLQNAAVPQIENKKD